MTTHTRREHYSAELDTIAIRFYCCGRYYTCHLCHAECAEHQEEQWPLGRWNLPAILCGAWWTELTIETYLAVDPCRECIAPFIPGCKAQSSYYFAGHGLARIVPGNIGGGGIGTRRFSGVGELNR